MMDDIAHLGKLELGELSLKEELFDLTVGLDLLKRQARGVLAAKNQQLMVVHQIYHQVCVADRNQMLKAFQNLVMVTSHCRRMEP